MTLGRCGQSSVWHFNTSETYKLFYCLNVFPLPAVACYLALGMCCYFINWGTGWILCCPAPPCVTHTQDCVTPVSQVDALRWTQHQPPTPGVVLSPSPNRAGLSESRQDGCFCQRFSNKAVFRKSCFCFIRDFPLQHKDGITYILSGCCQNFMSTKFKTNLIVNTQIIYSEVHCVLAIWEASDY